MMDLKQKSKNMENTIKTLQEQIMTNKPAKIDENKVINEYNERMTQIERKYFLSIQEKDERNKELIQQLNFQHKKSMEVLKNELRSVEEKCELLEREKNEISFQEKKLQQEDQQKFKFEIEKLLEENFEDKQKVSELQKIIEKQKNTIELQILSISSLERQLLLKKEQNEKVFFSY